MQIEQRKGICLRKVAKSHKNTVTIREYSDAPIRLHKRLPLKGGKMLTRDLPTHIVSISRPEISQKK